MMLCNKTALSGELVVDNFAGGGGASTGIAWAIGRDPDVAINHDASALEMHAKNHPDSKHMCEDIWQVDPRAISDGRPIGLAWFSPACLHFSRARGAKPVKKQQRALSWIVIKWAKLVRPRIIMLENVREFREWGPLKNERPDKERMGETYRSWKRQLAELGYAIEERDLNAADYGAPTHRRRLFLIARCDGAPITWPEPTHGPGKLPYNTAADCIDWSIPTNSIFNRKRPLAENTMKRIAKGLKKFVFEDPEPFIVRTGHYNKDKPVYFRGQSTQDPLGTVCAQGNDKALVVPYAVDIAHYTKDGKLRGQDLKKPLGTVVSHTAEKAIVIPHISQFYGGMVGKRADAPLPTVTSWDHNALIAAFVSRYYGTGIGSDMKEPLKTVTAQGNKFAKVTASMNKLSTVKAAAVGEFNNTEMVRAFLIKYYGTATGQRAAEPLHTITTKARLGVVTINGADYQITDIGLRMLQPRELARAQGFPDSYELTGTKANQIAKIGNSVCPIMAQRLVENNLLDPVEGVKVA